MAEQELDRIHIEDLSLRCIIGIYEEERTKKQDVIINLTMYMDLTKAAESDDIADTVDYKAIKEQVIEMVDASEFFLVERLAGRIAEICLENKDVRKVDVRVDKPGALSFARSVAVELTRENG